MHYSHREGGLISTVVLIAIGLIILGYFKISVREVIETPVVQENLLYAWDLFVQGIIAGWNWTFEFVKNLLV